MADDGLIPEDVRQLIAESLDSVAQMEALLLLRGEPEEAWTVATVARRLYIKETEANLVLGHLASRGLVSVADGAYRFQPATAEIGQAVENLAATYRTRLIAITQMIHSKTRPSSVQLFADVFRLRKDL